MDGEIFTQWCITLICGYLTYVSWNGGGNDWIVFAVIFVGGVVTIINRRFGETFKLYLYNKKKS